MSGLYFEEEGSGPAIVLIHGLAVSGRMFDRVRPLLSPNFRVVVPDMRGHGGSNSLGGPYGPDRMAQDVIDVLDRLEIRSAHILGYSGGGPVAQQIAARFPDRCDRLVLACTYAKFARTAKQRAEGRVARFLIPLMGTKRVAASMKKEATRKVDSAFGQELYELIAVNRATRMAGYAAATMRYDGLSLLASIQQPTLVIAGSEDEEVTLEHVQELSAGIRDSRLEVVQGGTHLLGLAMAPRFAEMVTAHCLGKAEMAAAIPG